MGPWISDSISLRRTIPDRVKELIVNDSTNVQAGLLFPFIFLWLDPKKMKTEEALDT